MSVCLECGKPACGEETYEEIQGKKITCYFCHEHINRAGLNEFGRRSLERYDITHQR